MPNGLRYLRWGGRGLCLGAGKTRSQKNAHKSRRLPHVRCTQEDGREPSFYTRERLVVYTKTASKVAIFQEKDAFFAIYGLRSENAVLGCDPSAT
jgi:hypothetical protein